MAVRDLRGRRVAITGAASGIGRATAEAMAAAGASVVMVDLNHEALVAASASVSESTRIEVCDVGDAAAVAAMAERLNNELGPIDVLINNAGIGFFGTFMEHEPEVWDRILRVNLIGVVNMIRAFLPAMQAAGGNRHIVNVASGVVMTPIPCLTAYDASKAAVHALGEALAGELHGTGITVQTVYPGIINTPIASSKFVGASMSQDRLDQIAHYYATKGAAPEVMARAIVAGIRSGKPRILGGPLSRSGALLSRLSPGLARWFTRKTAIEIGFLS